MVVNDVVVIPDHIEKAIELVKVAHEGQFRKDGVTPYFTHPYTVATLIQNYAPNNEPIIIAALTHDCLEDVDDFDLVEFLNAVYGEDQSMFKNERKIITDLVTAMTKNNTYTTRHERDLRSYEQLRRVGIDAIVLKLCDRLHNLSDMTGTESPGLSLAFQRRYIAETFFMLGYFKEARDLEVYRDLLTITNKLANKLYS